MGRAGQPNKRRTRGAARATPHLTVLVLLAADSDPPFSAINFIL
jgi:hypothetical protein